MILITGGTGFIGSRVIMRLVQAHIPFKILLRPKKEMARLPMDIPMDVVVSSLTDRRSLRSVLSGVSTILHFASAENAAQNPDYEAVEVNGTDILVKAAKDARVKKILYLSRIGADVNSSFPLLRAKAIAEKTIANSELDYFTLRLTDVFGKQDHFISEIVRYIRSAPGLIPMPEGGKSVLQPLWVDDLISAIFIQVRKGNFGNKIVSIGGGEFFDFKAVAKMIMRSINKRKLLLPVAPAYLRLYNLWFQQSKRGFPLSSKWLDLLAVNRTCSLDSLPRAFDLIPWRMPTYLESRDFQKR